MRLLFKQRFFSWFDSYDIYDEAGNTVFTVEGKLAWGHCLHILNVAGEHIGTVQQRVLTFLPKFELYIGEEYYGCICKEFTFFTPRFTLECSDWEMNGSNFVLGGSTNGWIEWKDRDGKTLDELFRKQIINDGEARNGT